MRTLLHQVSVAVAGAVLLAMSAAGQVSQLTGVVKGEDGKPLKDAIIRIERKDIKGNYKTKSNKKGEFIHAGLPLGTYKVTLEVDGKDRDVMDNVRTRLGEPVEVNFDLQAIKRKQDALAAAAATGQLTQEMAREMSPEQRAAMEKQIKERAASVAKTKARDEAYSAGMTAMQAQQWDQAVGSFAKAAEADPKQHVIWNQLAEAYVQMSKTKTGDEQSAILGKAFEAYNKAIEIKPDEPGYHNNYALALARIKKFPEAEAELAKAAQIDPPGAGKYFFNLGALLVNTNQPEPAAEAFKKAFTADPKHAESYYQYGVIMMAKAQTTPEGKIVPPPGTREAFEKYLEIAPTGPNSEAAKGMIAAMETAITTEYTDPRAKKKGGTKKK